MKRVVALELFLFAAAGTLAAQGLPFHTETALTTAFEERGFRTFVMAQSRGDADVLLSPIVVLPFAPHQRVTSKLSVPLVYKRADDFNSPTALRYSNAGIGDLSLAIKWAFLALDRFAGTTRLALVGSVRVPTGPTDAELDNGVIAPRPLQLGRGALGAGATLVATAVRGRWGVSADVGHVRNATDDGFRFGSVTRYDVAVGVRFPDNVATIRTPTVQLYLEWNGSVSARNAQDGIELGNSGGHVAYLSPGAQWVVLPQLLMEASVQIPVVQDHNGTQPDFGVRPAVGVRLLFF